MSLTRDRLANEEKFLDESKSNFHSNRLSEIVTEHANKIGEVKEHKSTERAFQDDIKPIVSEAVKLHRKRNRK